MSGRKGKIKAIVDQRKRNSESFREYTEWLINVSNRLEDCRRHLENPEISGQLDAAKQSSFISSIANISKNISNQRQLLEMVYQRFNRNTITIAIIGSARIGKSTFLQSFTGLTDMQIPTQVSGACTSTQSIISHIDDDQGYAIVRYYSKDEFINNIKNSYEKLHWDTAYLTSIEGFKSDFDQRECPEDTQEKQIYGELKLYRDNIDAINENVFQRSRTYVKVENLDEIGQFVTYSQENDIVQARASNLAVKKVEIFCKFPVDDVGQISVIDTPGMDTSTEDRDRDILIDVLKNSADFVLLFGCPNAKGFTAVDARLCSDFRKHMPLLDKKLERRAFCIVNQGICLRTDGTTEWDSTDDHNNRLYRSHYDNGEIPAADYIPVNAKDPQAVQEKVLDPMLTYLADEFPRLDALQVAAAKEILAGIGKDVEELLADIDSELGFLRTNDPTDYKPFLHEFEQLVPRLSSHLSMALEGMMPSRGIDIAAHIDAENNVPQGNVFTETLKQIVRNYKNEENTPDFLTINAIQNEMFNNSGQGGAAFFNLMSHLRCYIISLFAAMDTNCQQIVEEAKIKLENVFRDPEAGRLGNIKELDDKHGSEFFATLAKFARTVKAPILAEQLDVYAKFKLSFSGFMAHKVSAKLDPVRISGYRKVIDQVDFSSAEAIQEALSALGRRAMNDVAVELSQTLSSEPNEAVFAMSENFVDITLRTKAVKEDWSNLYFTLKGDVWPELFNPNHSANRSMLQMRENLAGLKSLVDLLKQLVA